LEEEHPVHLRFRHFVLCSSGRFAKQ